MTKRTVRRSLFFSLQADDWLVGEAERLDINVPEVVRRIVDEHRDRVALREIRRLRKGEPMVIARGGQGNRARKRDVAADRQLPLDCGA